MKFMNIFSVNKDKQNIFQIKTKYLGKRVVINEQKATDVVNILDSRAVTMVTSTSKSLM